jgi:hypothetical protein
MLENRAGAFDPRTLRILCDAFDKAWDAFLKRGELTPQNLHTSRERLALLILQEVKQGELNSHALARSAIGKLRQADLHEGQDPRQQQS